MNFMKKYYFILSVFILAMNFIACGSSKKAAIKESMGTEVKMPLSDKEYQTDSEYWRYTTEGTSPEMSVAKEIAVQAAREQIAAMVQAEIKLVTDRYAENFNIAGKTELAQIYERQAITAVKQTIVGSEVVGEKMFRTEDGLFKCFVCVQLNKSQVEEQIIASFENEEKIKTDFKRNEFRKIFDEETNKMK